jgi:hypothetical protein
MSHTEVAENLNELPNKSTMGLILGMAIKYGLPSVCCIWLFYVIWCKDQIIYQMSKDVTTALVESNHTRDEGNAAISRLAAAVDNLARK